jgi:hypothetical protein
MKTYYENLNGRVCCADHMGNYAAADLTHKPNARKIITLRDVWVRMTRAEVADFQSFLAEHGETEVCESCRCGAR